MVNFFLQILMLMPGRQIKNWSKYHALRRKGYSKTKAAKITNANPGKRKRK